jgi:hypothetical protein
MATPAPLPAPRRKSIPTGFEKNGVGPPALTARLVAGNV